MTIETAFAFPPGRPEEGRLSNAISALIELGWIAPERHGGYSNPLATPKKDAVEAITSYWREHGLVVVEGGGQS